MRWAQRNPERANELARQWRARNPDKAREILRRSEYKRRTEHRAEWLANKR